MDSIPLSFRFVFINDNYDSVDKKADLVSKYKTRINDGGPTGIRTQVSGVEVRQDIQTTP